MASSTKTTNKLVRLIEETEHKAYLIKDGKLVGRKERDLQESIVMHARRLGYKAINEDMLRIRMPYHQPLMDVVIEIDGYLHATEFKIMSLKKFQFFSGLDQALAYSLNGIDYSWLIHYLTDVIDARWADMYASLMGRIFQMFGIKQVGYFLIDPSGVKCKIEPSEPIHHDEQGKKMRQEMLRLLEFSQ